MSNRLNPIDVVTACMTGAGTPTLVLTTVGVSADEQDNGVHYDLVESQLLRRGYEEPFVHFDKNEAPAFLLAGVRSMTPASTPRLAAILTLSQEDPCPG